MRKCIKCGKEQDLSEFRDYWYAKTNICTNCVNAKRREEYQLYAPSAIKKQQQLVEDLVTFKGMVRYE
jgi:hypothetical protein